MPPSRSPHCAQRYLPPITLRCRFPPERAVTPPPITLRRTFLPSGLVNRPNTELHKIRKPGTLPSSPLALQQLLNFDKLLFSEIMVHFTFLLKGAL